MQRDDSENWSQFEEAPVETDTATLKQQLAEMAKQNHAQQQTIQQRMQQLQNLTTQFQSLTAQNLSGGSQLVAGNSLGADPSISGKYGFRQRVDYEPFVCNYASFLSR